MNKKRESLFVVIGTLAVVSPLVAQDLHGPSDKIRWMSANGIRPDNICYAEGTPEDYVVEVQALIGAEPMPPGFQLLNRWPGTTGDPIVLTWSIVPDGLIASGDPSTFFATMDAQFAGLGGREEWLSRLDDAFERWEELSGITFTRVTSGGNDWDDGASWGTSGNDTTRGDIRLAMTVIDGSNGILGFAEFPSNGDIVIDKDEAWTGSTFFNNVVMHETGHAIGMLHVCPTDGTKLMEPFLNTGFTGPQHDDIRGAQKNYGDIHESNNSSSSAPLIVEFSDDASFSLGIPPGDDTNTGSQLSIDAEGESDYYEFHVDYGGTADVFMTPLGLEYLEGPQNGNGTCPGGTLIDSSEMANLAVELRDTDGVTVLGTASSNGLGLFEFLDNVVLDEPGDYFIRIHETSSVTSTQLYRFTITVDLNTPPNDCEGDANGDGFVDPLDSGYVLARFGCDVGVGNPDCDAADQNGDMVVDPLDVGFVLARFGECP